MLHSYRVSGNEFNVMTFVMQAEFGKVVGFPTSKPRRNAAIVNHIYITYRHILYKIYHLP